MTVVLGHSSAWSYWLRTGLPHSPEEAADLPVMPQKDEAGNILFSQYVPSFDEKTMGELNNIGISAKKLHVCVSRPINRRAQTRACIHVHSAHLPQSSIMRISEHVYIASPEFLFLQKAADKSYSLERLILFGYGLCGRFALSKRDDEGCGLIQIRERTSKKRIASFLDDFEEINADHERAPKGLARARRALAFVIGSVESPPEARIAMLEFLPARLGGEGVRAPECNGVVKLPADLMAITGRSSFRCDFLWSEQKVVLEYNGTHHGEPREVNRDAEKYNALHQAGYEVILAAQKHISDPAHTKGLAIQLRKALGQRAPREKGDWETRQKRLRCELGLHC